MKYERKIVSTRRIMGEAWGLLKATRRPTMAILIFGLILPQIVCLVLLDTSGTRTAAKLRAQVGEDGTPFLTLLGPAFDFASTSVVLIALLISIIIASYYALTHIAVQHYRDATPLGAFRAWRLGLRATLASGVAILVGLMLAGMIGQILIAPVIVFGIMALIAPTIIVAEGKGVFRAIWDAMTMRYARQSSYSGWSILLVLLTIGALFYTLSSLTGSLFFAFLVSDAWIGLPRDAWVTTIAGMPFGPLYVIATLLEVSAGMALLTMLPALTTTLYFTVARQRVIGQA